MFVIFTLADLRCLRQAKAVHGALLDKIEADLRDLHRRIGGTVSVEEFTLGASGPFAVILQQGDGPGVYELLPDGAPQKRPEWVGRGAYGGYVVFHVIHLRGNGRELNIFFPAGTLDPDARKRLCDQIADDSDDED